MLAAAKHMKKRKMQFAKNKNVLCVKTLHTISPFYRPAFCTNNLLKIVYFWLVIS